MSSGQRVAAYGSMIVLVQITVLSGAMARTLAEEAPPAAGSMASAFGAG